MKGGSHITLLLLSAITFSACEGFFGKKTDLEFIDEPNYQTRDVAYVPVQPIIEGFAEPTDVVAGFDGLIYVVDAGTEEIIAIDVAGNELGRVKVPGVTKVVQDRRMNLLAIGTMDTTISDVTYTLATVYRLSLNGSTGYGIRHAEIVNRVINPFYFKSSFSVNDAQVRFTSVDVLADNDYYVSRTGPRDNEVQVGGPDDGVLLLNQNDKYVTNVFVTTDQGLVRGHFRTPLCITTLAKPPQGPFVNESRDFVVAMSDPTLPVKVQLINFEESEFGSAYRVVFLDYADTTEAHDFLYRPERFMTPTDMTIAGDGTNYLFVVDAEKDSLYQFTSQGYEGVNPPPGSSETKNIIASFGGRGQGPTQFNEPSAVAYLDQVIYVADKRNGRILRFKLTTDFD